MDGWEDVVGELTIMSNGSAHKEVEQVQVNDSELVEL